MDEERLVNQEGAQEEDIQQPAGQAQPQQEGESKPKKQKKQKDMSAAGVSRRAFIGGGVAAVCLLGLGGVKFTASTPVVRPPGGQDEDLLASACIRCMRCYEACPRNVIVPSHAENGLMGWRAPELDFEENYCDFCAEENGGTPLCVYNCPTHALRLDDGATATNTHIGLAEIDTYQCLAYRDTGCRKCSEVCPYEAIDLTGTENMPRPVVNADNCTGCGACEANCPSLKNGSIASGVTERAIVVRPFDLIS